MPPSTLRSEARDSFLLSVWFCPPSVLYTIIFLRTKDPFWPYLIVAILTNALYGGAFFARPYFRFIITQVFEFLYLGCVVTMLGLNSRWCQLKTWDDDLGQALLIIMLVFNTIQVMLSLLVNYRLTRIFIRYDKVYKSYYFRKIKIDIESRSATNRNATQQTRARAQVRAPPRIEELNLTPQEV